MALTITDILQLQSLQKFELVSGKKGLNHYVTSAEIADYEFCSDILHPLENPFEKESLVLSSLLFAKGRPEEILPAVEKLFESGVSGFAYKTVFFSDLPAEVLDFSNENNFPIFRFGMDAFFENVIFEIMDAIQSDDTNLLTENNLSRMINNDLPQSQVYFLSKNISLLFKEYAMGVYIKNCSDEFYMNLDRYFKNFYLNKGLNGKAILCKYKNGLFAILTSRQPSSDAFRIILDEMLDFFDLKNMSDLFVCRSEIHRSYEELDFCFRESYHTYLASYAEKRNLGDYSRLGTYQFLIPQQDSRSMRAFVERYISPLLVRPEYFDTMKCLVLSGGDVSEAAEIFHCHQNTIRYRVSKIKELLHLENETDQNFFSMLSDAMRVYLLMQP